MIAFKTESANVAAGMGITNERRDQLIDKFYKQIDQWRAAEDEGFTNYLLARAFTIAQTTSEQCYVCYVFGRFIGEQYGCMNGLLLELMKDAK